MDKVLLISELYPIPSKENVASKVCHFFTREWVKDGRRIVVVHFQPVHCRAWYALVRMFGPFLESRLNGLYYKKPLRRIQHYFMDGVEVFRIPCRIPIPRGRFSQKALLKFCEETKKCLEGIGFTPEMIVGHMLPEELIPMLNKDYKAKTCYVAHGPHPKFKQRYSDYRELIESYTGWGFRSEGIKKQFVQLNGPVPESFICYSGVPSNFFKPAFDRKKISARNILYVGDLIERKFPLEVAKAAFAAFGKNFLLTYVGDGAERVSIEDFIRSNSLEKQIHLVGKVSRDTVKEYMDKASVFVMVSRGEAYGLVYLEAMARGCLTIASEGEGMDGIIKDGINGYLLPSGDVEKLSVLLRMLDTTADGSALLVAEQGYKTALNYSDKAMADDYFVKLEAL